jgi:glycosyltransferase involved in cell wall biosynthesis
MRFLHVIHYPVFGGPHNEVLRLGSPLAERGWVPIVLLPDEPGNAAERLRAGGIDVVQAPLHRVRAGFRLRAHVTLLTSFAPEVARIRKLIADRGIELVVVGGLVNPHAALAARLEGVPLVWQILDTRPPLVVRRSFMPIVLGLADVVMFNGRALSRAHLGRRLLNVPYATYGPPVDTVAFVPSPERRERTRRELGIPATAPLVGTVANLNPQKGLEYFIRAAAMIHEQRPDVHFVVVGASYDTHRRYVGKLRRELAETSIPNKQFIFAGSRNDVENFYAAMDLKVVTSVPRSEGTTTTVLEAMACGLPVVATDVGAVPEAVIDGKTGFVVRPNDPLPVARSALRILTDARLHQDMSAAARSVAVEQFDVSVCVEKYVRIFRTAVRRRALMNGRRTSGDETSPGL